MRVGDYVVNGGYGYKQNTEPKITAYANEEDKIARQLTSAEIALNKLANLVEYAEGIASRLDNKVSTISLSPRPTGCDADAEKERETPPYFQEIYILQNRLRYALNAINDIVDRIDI